MAAETPQTPNTPWHLWLVGVLSLLWNLVGAFDFYMTANHNAAYLKHLTPAQLDYFTHFPLWAMAAWGMATWGSVAGSLALLARRRLAVVTFAVAIVGMILTALYSYVLTDGLKVSGSASGTLIFTAVIWVVAFSLWFYARSLARRGVLR